MACQAGEQPSLCQGKQRRTALNPPVPALKLRRCSEREQDGWAGPTSRPSPASPCPCAHPIRSCSSPHRMKAKQSPDCQKQPGTLARKPHRQSPPISSLDVQLQQSLPVNNKLQLDQLAKHNQALTRQSPPISSLMFSCSSLAGGRPPPSKLHLGLVVDLRQAWPCTMKVEPEPLGSTLHVWGQG